MKETTIIDYLTPTVEQIRHSINGIDDSYNNSWDVYAELFQNAVDAVRKSKAKDKSIVIRIDCPKRAISVEDNGIGIDPKDLPMLLKPFATGKQGDEDSIGEKGVGLKFVIFQSNYFKIKTGNKNGVAEAVIKSAKHWKERTDEEFLPLEFRELDEDFNGTKVEVSGLENYKIFDLSFDQIKYVIRTRTALGSTNKIWDDEQNVEISVHYKDINSNSFSEKIPFSYWLITEQLKRDSIENLEVFEKWSKEKDRSDLEKRSRLKDKIIFKRGAFAHSNQRKIKYFACFVPKRRTWNDCSINFNLASRENLEDSTWLSEYEYCTIQHGIFLSVKGMPTGISIDHPTTGYAGYWENFFIIFEDRFLKFDIGRKSIHGKQASIHREYAKRIFNEFLTYVTRYVGGDIQAEPSQWNKDEIFAEIDGIPDLNSESVKFQKVPLDQEASVVAIFFECIGSKKIEKIIPLSCGYRSKYDLYAIWDKKKIIIEFKSRLANLSKDFNDARKMFDEIDCVVCWEVTDSDKKKLNDIGVNVEEISASALLKDQRRIPHSTHVMKISDYVKPVYVIDLKKILES